jgi:hypothetical protein
MFRSEINKRLIEFGINLFAARRKPTAYAVGRPYEPYMRTDSVRRVNIHFTYLVLLSYVTGLQCDAK